MVACARPGSDTLVLLPMHQPCVAKVCCCSTNRPVPTEGRGGSADGRISDRDSLFTKEAHLRLCHRANECRLIGICQESTTVSTDLPGIDNRVRLWCFLELELGRWPPAAVAPAAAVAAACEVGAVLHERGGAVGQVAQAFYSVACCRCPGGTAL